MARKIDSGGPGRRSPMPFLPGPGKREIQRRLNWLINFLNVDIQVLSTGEFVKLLEEVLVFFYEDQIHRPLRRVICSDSDLNRQAVVMIQNWARSQLDEILRMTSPFDRDEEIRFFDTASIEADILIKGDKVNLVYRKKLRPYEVFVNLNPRPIYKENPADWQTPVDKDHVYQQFASLSDEEWEIHAFFSNCYDSDVRSSVLLSLVPLLENFPLECIRRCSGCGRYFTSTRKKKSPLCHFCYKRGRMPSWLRRPENREAWNEYNRNRRKGVEDEKPTQIRERLKAQSGKQEEENGTNN
jgi:hypothetical protein